jgi:hypothetical protein
VELKLPEKRLCQDTLISVSALSPGAPASTIYPCAAPVTDAAGHTQELGNGETPTLAKDGEPGWDAKSRLEKVRLILAIEGDLKPDAAVGLGNWLKRRGLDFAVIQPGADLVHSVAEGSWFPFYAYDKGWVERHIALLPLARERA